ncbi:Delta(12) acyl-lipid conjugase (11E,13E-forming) [Seminavis robusta]|uniref:Delta(12) acyl-lipid conjugase (11E,13E-forming) n=1 Tax=Seminavis robusta TaxID=568900 RepID=A0A9N8EFB7_9STRA|nr:Delta(12) acyl-lipid conjugase (11E,13E-forming) [Seminavis robusta]|eukprot:Sro908_g218890.1 Delta(12) acyl-lipid conjugase (11E,13E-forming) (471) ;mRNA; r:35069-36481
MVASTSAKDKDEWTSPFTPERIDSRVAGKTLEEINDQFPTVSEIRNVIPAHCFDRSLFWSFFYLVLDLLQGIFVWYITRHVIGLSSDAPSSPIWTWQWCLWRTAWNVYAVVMGFAVSGLWVLAHECSHGAFSKYPVLNGAVGLALHTFLCVPHFSWQFSHAKHHRRTNDLVDGESHVPATHDEMGLTKKVGTKEQYKRLSPESVKAKISVFSNQGPMGFLSNPMYDHALKHQTLGDTGFAVFMMLSRLLLGWQLFLFGISSNGKLGADQEPIANTEFPDHFRPSSRLFPSGMRWKVILSDVGVLVNVCLQVYFSWCYSWQAVWMWYWGPYVVVHAVVVTVTWLHHTHESVPNFDREQWSWMKTNIATTIDRPGYWWLNHCTHDINTTHLVHHIFPEIPHYRAMEATKAVRAYLEPKELYNYDPTDFCLALWKVCKTCHFVDSDKNGVQYFKKLSDVPCLAAEVDAGKKDS